MRYTARVPQLSLIVPVYNEAANIAPFATEVMEVLGQHGASWELLFIDDGSTDQSLGLLAALAAKHSNIKVISFARNFGKEVALSAGLQACAGQAAILMDCDLQHPPEMLTEMIARWQRGAHMVVGVRQWRDDQSRLRVFLTKRFYGLIARLSHIDITAHAADFRLLDRAVINVLNSLPERTRFMKGLYQWPGFRSDELAFVMRPRKNGGSRWSLRKLWRLAIDGICSVSTAPLKVWTYMGAGMIAAAAVLGVTAAIRYLAWDSALSTLWIGLSCGLALTGIVLVAQGISGEYLARIYEEVKGRPLFVVQSLHGFSHADPFALRVGAPQTRESTPETTSP